MYYDNEVHNSENLTFASRSSSGMRERSRVSPIYLRLKGYEKRYD